VLPTLAACSPPPPRPPVASPPPPAAWELQWADEFAGTDLNASNWSPMIGDGSYWGIPGWGNAERQYYTQRTENLRVENGELLIEAAYNDPPIIPNQVGAADCPWQRGCQPARPPAINAAAGRAALRPFCRPGEAAASSSGYLGCRFKLRLLPRVADAPAIMPLHSALILATAPKPNPPFSAPPHTPVMLCCAGLHLCPRPHQRQVQCGAHPRLSSGAH
jgi:hypothetical protein